MIIVIISFVCDRSNKGGDMRLLAILPRGAVK